MKRIIRKKFRRFWRSVINRRLVKYASRFGLAVFLLAMVLSFGKIQGTNSFFMDTATVAGNEISAGYWIPVLTMTVSPKNPDGQNNFYVSHPCVTLEAKLGGSVASLSEVDIFYEFSNDGNPVSGGTKYDGTCVSIPDGNPTYFQAIAVNKLNSDWKSNVVNDQFKVDTQCPVVEITNPDSGDDLSGSVEIRGTVTDANPHHYWLVIENSSGAKVAGPGTVNDANSFTDKKFFDWDTTAVLDGDYKIKLEARDAAGNKCPNQAPVLADPNDPNDSVDWIDVTVANTPVVSAGDVIINEVMWMGSFAHPHDEWIELKNTTGHPINVKNWNIEGAVEGSGGHLEIAGNTGHEGDDMIIPAHGYFLIANYNRDSSDINVDVDLVKTSISLNDEYDDNGPLVLKDTSDQTIDATAAPTGHSWPAGIHGLVVPGGILHWSMERNNTPSSGWHTCDPTAMTPAQFLTMKSYWDWDALLFNCGTPGHANLSKNDPSKSDIEEYFNKSEIKEDVVLEPLEKSGNDGVEALKITKKVPIKVVGAPDVAEGLKYKIDQRIKKVNLSGDFPDKEIIVDLAKLGLIEKTGEIKIRISDLDLPDGVEVVSQKDNGLVLLITVEKQKDKVAKVAKKNNKSGKKSKKKGKAELKQAEQAALPDSGKESGSGDGDPNNNNKNPIT
ncbi:MAG: lamin tail domain-containing protein [Candidatus Moranbacteria bacterium]|nr:lamin tail domain-containing protein [Candidatus Moranbacteria bacterium]